ncbi:MAG TPA: phosphate ABC transporter substrate-binding protein PstS [Vicinamibacterales bacterium]
MHSVVRYSFNGFLAVGLALAACGGSGSGEGGTGSAAQINGAGATFPYPIYSKWFAEYNRLHPDVRINYQSQGSGAGIRQLTNKTVFFGASDQPMKDEQLASAPGEILHFPTVLGAVVPVYNLQGVTEELKFSGLVLANIVLGKITKWNDPALVTLNPGVSLPDSNITFVHRSDGSGTTFVWADYLSKVSPEFESTVGADSSLKWPVGIGGKGNEGVAGLVAQTPGSLGYVELIYALQNNIAYGAVQNAMGNFVKASIENVTAAAEGAAADMPADFRVSITNPPGENAYPIASFTWILLYQNPDDKAQARVMVEFMKWALTDGQRHARELGYAPLPRNVIDMELNALEQIQVQ